MAEQQPMEIEAFAKRVAAQMEERSPGAKAIDPAMIVAIIEMIKGLIDSCPSETGFMQNTKSPRPFFQAVFRWRIVLPIANRFGLDSWRLSRVMISESAKAGDKVRKKIWDEVETPDFSVV